MPAMPAEERDRMNQFDLTGKVAVITGSSRGIGRAIAEAMADHGARVVISSRKAEACAEAADAINAKHGDGHRDRRPANISSKEALQALVDETRRQLGRIDILVCNAASNPITGRWRDHDDQFRKILDNNVIANHWLISMVAPEMVERGEGSIIIISSIGGLTSSTMIGAYNISKAADFQLARNLAAEFGPAGVRVNCIAPGLVRTDFARALWENPDTLKAVTRSTPMRRIGEPHEIAGAAVFLASPASTFMTGQTVVVDGGSTIGVGVVMNPRSTVIASVAKQSISESRGDGLPRRFAPRNDGGGLR
jgi:NAD(P)-dependent dehydrogenase (short-subunit alcohol dehydrogenase family)